MEDSQRRIRNAAASGLGVLDVPANTVIWDAVTRRTDLHVEIGGRITTIDSLDLIIKKDNKGIATGKKGKKKDAALKAVKVAKALTVFAKDTANATLKEEINLEFSDLNSASDAEAPNLWKLIFDRASVPAVSAALIADYGIVAGDITAISTARLAFLAVSSDPDTAKAAVSAAKEAQKLEFEALDLTVENIKELAVVLKAAEPDLVNALMAALKIDNTGVRKISLEVIYKDKVTGVLLPKVKSTLMETNEVKLSSPKGRAAYKSEEQGNYTLLSEKPTYKVVNTPNIGIQDGKVTRLVIEMEKL